MIATQGASARASSRRNLGDALAPPLKWAGGKRWLVPHLLDLWRPHAGRRLVEPFCGGLGVTLSLMPARALLNDVNAHLINFYRRIAGGLVIGIPMRNESALYYDHRARFNALLSGGKGETREAAALFYYLNRTGYNGLCRFNAAGEFNVPFGDYARIPYVADFGGYRDALSRWEFTEGDFGDVALAEDDFVYADPPYDVEFTRYAKEGFSWEDQERLADLLSRHRGPVLLSNQATDRVVRLYRKTGFRLEYLEGPRRISCNGDRRPAREVLASRGLDPS